MPSDHFKRKVIMEKELEVSQNSPGFSKQTFVVIAKDLIHRDVKGETIILNKNSGVYCGLNEVGSLVWEFMKEPRSVESLKDIILKEYDVEPGQCEIDLFRLLQDLLDNGLIEVTHP